MSAAPRSPSTIARVVDPITGRVTAAGIACSISPQAIRLHAYGVIASILAGSRGVIGQAAGEELARSSGALVDELVGIGLWLETDLAYVVRAGALAAALDGVEPVSPRG